MSTRTFQLTVATQTGPGAPTWLSSLGSGAWRKFDTGPRAVTGLVHPYRTSSAWTNENVTDFGYSGAVVHQGRNSLMVSGGGHASPMDNGVYEFDPLDTSGTGGTPKFKAYTQRDSNILPASALLVDINTWFAEPATAYPAHRHAEPGETTNAPYPATGGPVQQHTYNRNFYDINSGELWLFNHTAIEPTAFFNRPPGSRNSGNVFAVWKMNEARRASMAASGQYTLTPWDCLYTPQTCPATYVAANNAHPLTNPYAGHILLVGGNTLTVNPTTGAMTQISPITLNVTGGSSYPISYAPMFWRHPYTGAIEGQPYYAVFSNVANNFVLLNLQDYADSTALTQKVPATAVSDGNNWNYSNVVYDRKGDCFYRWGLAFNGIHPNSNRVWKLTKTSGTWVSGTYRWDAVDCPTTAGSTPPISTNEQVYGRFNVIRKVGGSDTDILLINNGLDGATYVCRLPDAGGLT